MNEFVDALRQATAVTTPIGLVAFVAVLILWGILRAGRSNGNASAGRESTIKLGMVLFAILAVVAMVPQVVALIPAKVPKPPIVSTVVTEGDGGSAVAVISYNAVAIGAASRLMVEYATDSKFESIISSHELTSWTNGKVTDQFAPFPNGEVFVRLVTLDRNGKRIAIGDGSPAIVHRGKSP